MNCPRPACHPPVWRGRPPVGAHRTSAEARVHDSRMELNGAGRALESNLMIICVDARAIQPGAIALLQQRAAKDME